MQGVQVPIIKDVVLVGAGHAHVGVLRRFGMRPVPGVRLTLITREVDTPYSGMLPGFIAGHYEFDDIHIDTGPLARFASARLYQSEAVGLDLEANTVVCRDRPPVNYDILSIDIGSTPGGADISGVAEHAIAVKPIDHFLVKFQAARRRILEGGQCRIGVVGGGPAGIELTMALHERLTRELTEKGANSDGLSFEIVTGAATIVPALPVGARQRFGRILSERGIKIHTGAHVIAIKDSKAVCADGRELAFDEIFWTTQAAATRWLTKTGLDLDTDGFIAVDDTLRSVSHSNVFAAGDCATMIGKNLPKSGVYAVRQGPYLDDNIRRMLAGRTLRRYRPQSEALYLISTGDRYAIGARNGLTAEGAWLWRLKDWIDRRFMEKFSKLPAMKTLRVSLPDGIADGDAMKEISAIAMRCGGCGAKVGATVLSRALSEIAPVDRPDVIVGLKSPDDAAIVDTGGHQLSVQTVDYFRTIIDDPYVFGQIAANHALGDIYAMGGAPQTALAIATIPYGIESKVEATLSEMMTGANEVLRDAGCALVGGHTSEGAELAFGFSVNGLIDRDRALRKSGLKPGDALIVTKPVGTGTLLAAHMQGKAKARWVMAALKHMTVSNRRAAEILRRHSVHAATDVTGFGLVGHLVEMVRASDVDATIWLTAIPRLEGASETIVAGIFSSMQPQNVRLRRAIRNLEEASRDPDYPLLFDPQTAGGLLAAVPCDLALTCVEDLKLAGYKHAAVIGHVTVRSAALEPIVVETGRQ